MATVGVKGLELMDVRNKTSLLGDADSRPTDAAAVLEFFLPGGAHVASNNASRPDPPVTSATTRDHHNGVARMRRRKRGDLVDVVTTLSSVRRDITHRPHSTQLNDKPCSLSYTTQCTCFDK